MADVPFPGSSSSDVDALATAQTYADFGREIAAAAHTRDVLDALVEVTAREVPGARWVSVSRGRGDRFVTVASSDPVAIDADRLQYELGIGPCLEAVVESSVFESPDLAHETRWAPFGPRAAAEHGTLSVLSTRLTMEGDEDLNAGLNMYGDRPDAFDESSHYLATLLATHAAVGLASVVNRENARNLRTALESNREIGVAMGVLMATMKLTREQAFDLLRIASQNTNRKLRDVARDVGDTGSLELPPPGRPGR